MSDKPSPDTETRPANPSAPTSSELSPSGDGIELNILTRAKQRYLRFLWSLRNINSWAISLVMHAGILVALGLWIEHVEKRAVQVDLTVRSFEQPSGKLEDLPLDLPAGEGGNSPVAGFGNQTSGPPGQDEPPIGQPNLGSTVPFAPAGPQTGPATVASGTAKLDPLASLVRSDSNSGAWGMTVTKGGGGLGGRSPGMRAKLAGQRGGSHESEAAVERGLKWLLAHQHEDGGWRFGFTGAPCDGLCRNGGSESSTTAATALALLPFYGAGYTHKEGPYTEQINKGLYYLGNHMLITPQGGDLQEGTMYAQGLSTITLCEAYAMSKDENLRQFAQSAVNFIVYAQDKQGGGWRYFPGQPGDTSVTGWQLMALKSAKWPAWKFPRPRSRWPINFWIACNRKKARPTDIAHLRFAPPQVLSACWHACIWAGIGRTLL